MRPLGVIVVEDAITHAGSGHARVGALEHVANRPIADHVVDALALAGVQDIVVACPTELAGEVRNCLAVRVGASRPRLVYVEGPGSMDVSDALRLAAPIVGDAPCIVHLASGLLGEPLAPFLGSLSSGSPDVVVICHQGPAPSERLSPGTQSMLHIAELDPERAPLGMAGVWLLGPDAIRHAGSEPWRSGGDIELMPVAERVAAQGGGLHVRFVDAWRTYRGDPVDLLELNQFALDGIAIDQRRSNSNGNRIEGRVHIHEGASVHASVIVGPVVIGPGARIADAYIGPYTSIGEGARIEGAEIERSIIAEGASIMHIGGRLAGSIVGRDARVFRDFSLPRVLRLRVGDGTEVAFC